MSDLPEMSNKRFLDISKKILEGENPNLVHGEIEEFRARLKEINEAAFRLANEKPSGPKETPLTTRGIWDYLSGRS